MLATLLIWPTTATLDEQHFGLFDRTACLHYAIITLTALNSLTSLHSKPDKTFFWITTGPGTSHDERRGADDSELDVGRPVVGPRQLEQGRIVGSRG